MGRVRYTNLDGQIIAENRNGVNRSYVPDAIGSTVALVDDQQQVVERGSYWPYGAPVTSPAGTRFGFVGTLGYASTGAASYVRARTYTPGRARWTSPDPWSRLAEEFHDYHYCLNNPLSFVDPTGLAGKPGKGPFHPPEGVKVRCTDRDFCEDLRGKIWLLEKVIKSHQGWDRHVAPPRGGGRHAEEIANFYRALARCQALLAKCKPRRQPARRECRVPVPSPVFQPIFDEDTTKKIIGGLVICYFIVRIAGRVVCPATNLIPAP